jgi:nucleoside-diphosphate-sugar epimerase
MGDFIDTRPSGNWFDLGLTAKVDKGVFTYPGPMDRTHAWAYLPDAARAFVALADMRDRLGRNAEFTYEGYALTGSELHRATEAALGRKLRLGGFPWLAIRAVGLVNPMMRAMASMSYLWRMPHRLSGQALHRLLPEFRETPVEEAVAQALGVGGQKAAA